MSNAAAESEFEALLEELRAGAAERERSHSLPFDAIERLQALATLDGRIPVAFGGEGTSLEVVCDRLIRLAAADSNVAHAYRGHVAYIEQLLLEPDEERQALWFERIRRGAFIGNAQSEKGATADTTTSIDRSSGEVLLTGTKYYTTGSIFADWIQLAAKDGDEIVDVAASTAHPGVRSIDDWDGIGQRLTGSGTTVFTAVPIDPSDIRPFGTDAGRDSYLTGLFQLILLAVVAGIAQSALEETVAFVTPRRRIFGYSGETLPRENHLVQTVVGDLSAAAFAAREIVLANARELGRALDTKLSDAATSGEDASGLLLKAELNVFKAQQIVLPLVLKATTELFEVGGASAVSQGVALDRHWRNVRTIASHNPAIQRKRALGDYELNGRVPTMELFGPALASAPATP